MSNDSPAPITASPAKVIEARLVACQWQFESKVQTSYAIIGALEQHGWVIVRKRHMRLPK